jgi:flagellar biosynthesis chaperone FliJ
MAVSNGLRRLLQLRCLEEEQSRTALESAHAEVHRLERALEAAGERNRRGRQLVHQAARTGELIDRIAGIEEGRAAVRLGVMLEAAIVQSKHSADIHREKFQSTRTERRQVETLISDAEAAEALDRDRRSQQSLDDWYGSRRQVALTASSRAKHRVEKREL